MLSALAEPEVVTLAVKGIVSPTGKVRPAVGFVTTTVGVVGAVLGSIVSDTVEANPRSPEESVAIAVISKLPVDGAIQSNENGDSETTPIDTLFAKYSTCVIASNESVTDAVMPIVSSALKTSPVVGAVIAIVGAVFDCTWSVVGSEVTATPPELVATA